MCYATSMDGIRWEKPSLGLVEFDGSKDNNIVLMAQCMMHDPTVIIDRKDPDPQRRLKAMWWGGRKDASQEDGWLLGHCVAFSPDGLRWTEHPDNPVWLGDGEGAAPLGLERGEGRFVMYSGADGYGMRVVGRSESDDFVHWDLPPQLVFRSDEEDVPGTEMAGLFAIDYDGTYVGMLGVIRNLRVPEFTAQEWQEIVERNIQRGYIGPPIGMGRGGAPQYPRIMYPELVTSRDGIQWQRIHRHPFIPLGPEGSWDKATVLAARPLVANDRIYIYYTGQGRGTTDTGLATLRLDGFVSLEAGTSQGVVVTKSFELEATDLRVNVDAAQGSVRLEVLDEQDQPIPGFTRDEANPITGDQLWATATWGTRSGVSELRGRCVKLRLFLQNAHLYSISTVNQA